MKYNWCGKKLLVLGATRLMAEIVREAQRYGAYVIVVDYNEEAPAKSIADEKLLLDATDVEGLSEYVLKNNVDGILTGFADSLLPAYIQLCAKTNRPCYLTEQMLKLSTDKNYFKQLCRRFQISTIREYNAEEKITNFPLIVKPVDNSGSRGISICENASQLQDGIQTALACSKSKSILIEDYLLYPESTVFYYFIEGKPYLISVSDRHVAYIRDGFVRLPTGYTFNSGKMNWFYETVHPKFSEMFKFMGVRNGLIFIQGFLTDDDFIPYEAGFRLTGSLEYRIFEKMYQANTLGILIDYALNGNTEDILDGTDFVNNDRKAYNLSVLIKPGKIEKIVGIDEVCAHNNVLSSFNTYETGDVLPENSWGKLAQIGLRFFYYGDDATCEEILSLVDHHLHVFNEHGDDLIINRGIIKD